MNHSESKTFAFEITTDDNLLEAIAYIGSEKFSLEKSNNLFLLKLSDKQTHKFRGFINVSLSLELENYGHQKINNVFTIEIETTNAVNLKDITTDVIALTVPITINEENVTVDHIVYDYVQGESYQEAFETVSKNLKSHPYQLNYTNGILSNIVYSLTLGTITKTLNYTNNILTSIVLSEDTPNGINLTKTLNYTNNILTSINYN